MTNKETANGDGLRFGPIDLAPGVSHGNMWSLAFGACGLTYRYAPKLKTPGSANRIHQHAVRGIDVFDLAAQLYLDHIDRQTDTGLDVGTVIR